MAPLDFLSEFRSREGQEDPLKAIWYIAAATGIAAASMGELIPDLYSMATVDLPLESRKIVQRRIKEALTKGAVLYGVPRSGQALGPLFNALPADEIDTYAPRLEGAKAADENEKRIERGRKYFDILWTPDGAKAMIDRVMSYHPDQYFLNMKTIYEFWISDDRILTNVETQMCNTTLLTCWNSPVQALWHTRGIVRHGGSIEQARFAQDLGIAIARQFDCKTGELTMVDNIDF